MPRRPIGVLLVGALVAGCASTVAPSAPAASVGPSASAAATVAPVASPTRSHAPGGGIGVDERLVEVLPADIDGVPLQFSAEASEETAANGVPGVDALAYALAAGPSDLLIASVVRPEPDAFDAAFFRTWRDTYTEGVCRQAGGVQHGVAETQIDGRNVFIGSCVNGGHTYYTWLDGPGVIVSAYAIGERRFGERLIESLEE